MYKDKPVSREEWAHSSLYVTTPSHTPAIHVRGFNWLMTTVSSVANAATKNTKKNTNTGFTHWCVFKGLNASECGSMNNEGLLFPKQLSKYRYRR